MFKQHPDLLSGLTELFAGMNIKSAACVDDVFEFLEDFRFSIAVPWSARFLQQLMSDLLQDEYHSSRKLVSQVLNAVLERFDLAMAIHQLQSFAYCFDTTLRALGFHDEIL